MKREVLGTARTAQDLHDSLDAKARELELSPSSQDKRNDWGPVYSNDYYDLRIDKRPGREEYTLMLLHKVQPHRALRKILRRS